MLPLTFSSLSIRGRRRHKLDPTKAITALNLVATAVDAVFAIDLS